MTAAVEERLWTVGDLFALPDDGYVYELSRGRLIRTAPASWLPGVVSAHINELVNAYVREHGLGFCADAQTGYQLSDAPDSVRAPDLGFVRAERVSRDNLPTRFFPGPPDLAVEVKSPTDRMADVLQKIGEYLDAGVRLVWFFNPERRSAIVFRPDGSVTLLQADDELDGEDVLPGFRLPLTQIWL